MKNWIYDVTLFTMLDYPDELSCIVWLSKCTLRCRYCHNPQIVLDSGKYETSYLYDFLTAYKNKLSAVVFSGGEATCCPNLKEMCTFAKELGYKVKVDTNGTNTEIIRDLITNNLLDMIAIDYKAPRDKFKLVTGKSESFYDKFLKTLILAIESKIPLIIRTTVHKRLLDNNDILDIQSHIKSLGYEKELVVQQARTHVEIMDMTLGENI